MNKESKRAYSDRLNNNAVDLRSGVYDFTPQLRILPQMKNFVLPVTRQFIGVLIERGNKGTPLTNYVRNIMFGSYHAADKSEFIKALQSAIDLVSIYILDQRLPERDAIVRSVNNVVDYLGCLYLLKTEGLDREVPHQVNPAIAYLNGTAVTMSNLIKEFQSRCFPNHNSGNVNRGNGVGTDNYYSPPNSSSGAGTAYYDTNTNVNTMADYRNVGSESIIPPYETQTSNQPQVSGFNFRPVRLDNTTWLFDPETNRPVYELETDRTYYYVHERGDWWRILTRNIRKVGEAEFTDCRIELMGQPVPKEEGYEPPKPKWDASAILQKAKPVVTDIKPTGSSILEEVTFSPDSEVEVKRSVHLPAEDSEFSSYASEEIIMADFVADQNVGTEKVEKVESSKYTSPTVLNDGTSVVLATPENLPAAIATMKLQNPLTLVPAYYPDKEMLFILTSKDGTVELLLNDDEEVLMDTKLERMMLASGISRTPHSQEAAHSRTDGKSEDTFFSGMEIHLAADHAAVAQERKILEEIQDPEVLDSFVYNDELSFNYIVEAPSIFSACAKARVDVNKNTEIPFRYHHTSSFVPDENHPGEKVDENGKRKIITALEQIDTGSLVEFLFNEYNLGARGERMTPIAWYIVDTIVSTINSFIEQEMGLVRFCAIESLRNDYYEMFNYVRNKKGEVVAKALFGKNFHNRIRAAIGNVEEIIITNEETNETITRLDFVKVDFALYWPMDSQQVSFLMLDQTVVIDSAHTPALYNICWRMVEMAEELVDRDKIVVNNILFVTKDHRLLRVLRSPYSNDLLLTATKVAG